MESPRGKRLDAHVPEGGEIVLILGEEKNRGRWKKGKVIRIVRGADGVARGVILLHKGKQLERPIQSVCPLEIRSAEHEPEQGADPKKKGAYQRKEASSCGCSILH